MRHKYDTRALVLARHPSGEANAQLVVLTPDLGLVRARAEAIRRSKAKLAHALVTLSESDVVLVRGRGEWRLAGAVLVEPWFKRIKTYEARVRAARFVRLVLRLVGSESPERSVYGVAREFLESLSTLPPEDHEPAEMLASLRLLQNLGFDTGELPAETFAPESIAEARARRSEFVARINRGMSISGL